MQFLFRTSSKFPLQVIVSTFTPTFRTLLWVLVASILQTSTPSFVLLIWSLYMVVLTRVLLISFRIQAILCARHTSALLGHAPILCTTPTFLFVFSNLGLNNRVQKHTHSKCSTNVQTQPLNFWISRRHTLLLSTEGFYAIMFSMTKLVIVTRYTQCWWCHFTLPIKYRWATNGVAELSCLKEKEKKRKWTSL